MRVTLTEASPRVASLKTDPPGSPGYETERVGQRPDVYLVYGSDAPKIPPFRAGEESCFKDYPRLGNRSIFYPYSSVGNTFTLISILA